jgi:hypothetical protein
MSETLQTVDETTDWIMNQVKEKLIWLDDLDNGEFHAKLIAEKDIQVIFFAPTSGRWEKCYIDSEEFDPMLIQLPLTLLATACQQSKPVEQDRLTFYEDVQPILEQHCVRCHQSEGQGVGDFTDPESVVQLAPLLVDAIEAGTMPPPASDPDCHDYQGSETVHMSDEDAAILSDWVEIGSPLGDPATAQTYDHSPFTLEDPDLELLLPEPYTPTFADPQNPGNEYRCFSIEHGKDEPFYITAMHPIIDRSDMVHHIVLGKGSEDGIVSGSKNPEGADCISGGAFITNFQNGAMLGGWAPGMQPVHLEDGGGILVFPDEYIVIQMHYYQNGDSTPPADQSGYAFHTSDSAEHSVQMFPLGSQGFQIPAGDDSYSYEDSFSLPFGVSVWGIFPHMHVLGSGYEMDYMDDEGERHCLAQSDGFDFDNQLMYMYNKPERIERGQRIRISCTWNNSESNPDLIHSPPIDVGYGERTDEEMCFGFSLISFD